MRAKIVTERIHFMIADKNTMKKTETASGFKSQELMEKAGLACAEKIRQDFPDAENVLILAGKGNNGGDGLVMARILKEKNCRVYLVEGNVKTPEAKHAYRLLSRTMFIKKEEIEQSIRKADLIVDAVYGFSYHGNLNPEVRKLFLMVNHAGVPVVSIDINSGCECDSGYCDVDAIHSEVTYALDCRKPFHAMRRNHRMCERVETLSLDLPHTVPSSITEMNEDIFFQNFPKKPENAYKGTYGKTLLVGGSYGMAGAISMNIIGAKTIGAGYINVALPEEIYPIVASHHITPVFHPLGHNTMLDVLRPLISGARTIAFGSGAVNMDHKNDVLDLILQNSEAPIVLDAEALNLLHQNTYILRLVHEPVIVTPHVGEFSRMISQPVEAIHDHALEYAQRFARNYHTYVVLKQPSTIVASPDGRIYINESGNQALAQAGSGDLLTGILAGMLTMTSDVWKAICMAVWLHGYLADLGIQKHAIQNFRIESYPEIMDELFHKHGY